MLDRSHVALMRRLVVSGWGASARTLHTAVLALVYSTGEYCAPVRCRSAHTLLVDTPINEALRIVTGCLRPTPEDNVSILAVVQPSEPRHMGATARLVSWAMETNHLLHQRLTATSETPTCLRSRHPFVPATEELLQQCRDLDTSEARWADYIWSMEWEKNTSRLHDLPNTGSSPIGMHQAWVWLNHLRTSIGRFHSSMHSWSLAL